MTHSPKVPGDQVPPQELTSTEGTPETKKSPEQATLQEIVDVITGKNLPVYDKPDMKMSQGNLYRSPDPNSDRVLATSYKNGFYGYADHADCLAWVLTPKSYIPSDSTYGINKITNYRIYETEEGLTIKKIWRAVNREDYLIESPANIADHDDMGRLIMNMMERTNTQLANDLERDKFEDEHGLRVIDEQEAQELLSLVREWQPLPPSTEG